MKSDQSASKLFVDPPSIISDHSLIGWCLPFAHQPPIIEMREVRSWCKVNRDDFRSALGYLHALLFFVVAGTANELFELYCSTLKSLADEFAPVRRLKMRWQLITAWMDRECHDLRCHSRMLERHYRRTTKSTGHASWVKHERTRYKTYRAKENAYWTMYQSAL